MMVRKCVCAAWNKVSEVRGSNEPSGVKLSVCALPLHELNVPCELSDSPKLGLIEGCFSMSIELPGDEQNMAYVSGRISLYCPNGD